MLPEPLSELSGANMDIDLTSDADDITWRQDKCPWNIAEKVTTHKCAVKHTAICKYFNGVKKWDIVICSYPRTVPEETE